MLEVVGDHHYEEDILLHNVEDKVLVEEDKLHVVDMDLVEEDKLHAVDMDLEVDMVLVQDMVLEVDTGLDKVHIPVDRRLFQLF
jgi:hypothetical protein